MSKTIVSPVKRWPGNVIISYPLTMPQYMTWIETAERANEVASITQKQGVYLPGVLACVEKWELGGGFPLSPSIDNFPGSPAKSVMTLLLAVINEIWAMINEDDEVPNA